MVEFVVVEQLVEFVVSVEFVVAVEVVPFVVLLVPPVAVGLPPTVPVEGMVCEQLVVPRMPVVVPAAPAVAPTLPVVVVPVVPVEPTEVALDPVLPAVPMPVPVLPVVLGRVAELPVVVLGVVEIPVVPEVPVVFWVADGEPILLWLAPVLLLGFAFIAPAAVPVGPAAVLFCDPVAVALPVVVLGTVLVLLPPIADPVDPVVWAPTQADARSKTEAASHVRLISWISSLN